jgi:hypothetical protein
MLDSENIVVVNSSVNDYGGLPLNDLLSSPVGHSDKVVGGISFSSDYKRKAGRLDFFPGAFVLPLVQNGLVNSLIPIGLIRKISRHPSPDSEGVCFSSISQRGCWECARAHWWHVTNSDQADIGSFVNVQRFLGIVSKACSGSGTGRQIRYLVAELSRSFSNSPIDVSGALRKAVSSVVNAVSRDDELINLSSGAGVVIARYDKLPDRAQRDYSSQQDHQSISVRHFVQELARAAAEILEWAVGVFCLAVGMPLFVYYDSSSRPGFRLMWGAIWSVMILPPENVSHSELL